MALDLTTEEKEIIDRLGEVWSTFCKLPCQHRSEAIEFAAAIHRLQDMIAARPAYRRMTAEHQVKQRRNGDG